MGYKCSFLDNKSYTAQDVNDIFARIVSGGVVFTDTGYILSDLNEAQAQTVSSGVTRDISSCKVVCENGIYKISKGACFMNDGSAIVFDEDGVILDVMPDSINYVYLVRNEMDNTIDIVVSGTAGGEGTVPLAYIDTYGNVYDRRAYAKAKVDLLTGSNIRNFTVKIYSPSTTSEEVTVDVGDGQFSYFVFWDGEMHQSELTKARVIAGKNLNKLADGEEISLTIGENERDNKEYLYVTKNGQYLELHLKRSSPYAEYIFNIGVI